MRLSGALSADGVLNPADHAAMARARSYAPRISAWRALADFAHLGMVDLAGDLGSAVPLPREHWDRNDPLVQKHAQQLTDQEFEKLVSDLAAFARGELEPTEDWTSAARLLAG
jgi:hypothetical protein